MYLKENMLLRYTEKSIILLLKKAIIFSLFLTKKVLLNMLFSTYVEHSLSEHSVI